MSATTSKKSRLTLESLGERVVPATLSGGHVVITGTAAADKVDVSHFTDRGIEYVYVVQNGTSQKFGAKSVTGLIKFNGNNGNDAFKYTGTRGVLADGGAGNDTLQGGSGNDSLFGGANDDKIYGNAGTNRLEGGSGNDNLYGSGGTNTMLGNDGNDFLEGGNLRDVMQGNAGNDTLRGWGGNDELQGGVDNDIIFGGTGSDRLFGEAGNDALLGEDGDDVIVGGSGLDYAFGGAGKDEFWEVASDAGKLPSPLNTPHGKVVFYGVQDFNPAQGDVKKS